MNRRDINDSVPRATIWHHEALPSDPGADLSFSHTFAEKIEKSMNLRPVCKLFLTYLCRKDRKIHTFAACVQTLSHTASTLIPHC